MASFGMNPSEFKLQFVTSPKKGASGVPSIHLCSLNSIWLWRLKVLKLLNKLLRNLTFKSLSFEMDRLPHRHNIRIFFQSMLEQPERKLIDEQEGLAQFRNVALLLIALQVCGTTAGFLMYVVRKIRTYLYGNMFSMLSAALGFYGASTFQKSFMSIYAVVFPIVSCWEPVFL